ncbi:MAG: TerB N-terminal domain-containing protein [Pseudomonadota bacterium]
MFDLIKSIFSNNKIKHTPSTQNKSENNAPSVQHYPALLKIPHYRKELLYLSNKEPRGHGFGLQISITLSLDGNVDMDDEIPDDPSTIYSTLPLRESNKPVTKLSYFPSYSGMLPEQRAVYLRWLCDISQEIDIGYVFVFYYGLERHLISGNFDEAAKEILQLRKLYKNSSFQSYSASALIHSCLIRKRLDVLQKLYTHPDFDYFNNSNLLILYHSGLEILPDMMIRLAKCLYAVNRRYLRLKPDLYLKILIDTLNDDFGKPAYPFAANYELKNIKGIPYPIFANISLPNDIRSPSIPNFLQHPPFQQELGNFFQKIHDTVKQQPKQAKS